MAFVRSPYPRARIDAIDVEAAKASTGVRGVFVADDLKEGLKLPPAWRGSLLAAGYASYAGEPVVMVVADSRAEAEDAAELVEVSYSPEHAVTDLEEAIAGATTAHPADDTNLFDQTTSPGYDTVDAIIAAAPRVFNERIDQHRYVHSPMETRGLVADWHSADSTMTIWISTQGPHPAVNHFANILQLPPASVRVLAEDVGGAFGQKIAITREETSIAVASRLLGRPVQWIEDRYENLLAAPHARREFADVSVGTTEDGIILAMKVDQYQDCGAFGGSGGGNFVKMIPGPYRVPTVEVRSTSVRTNTSSVRRVSRAVDDGDVAPRDDRRHHRERPRHRSARDAEEEHPPSLGAPLRDRHGHDVRPHHLRGDDGASRGHLGLRRVPQPSRRLHAKRAATSASG